MGTLIPNLLSNFKYFRLLLKIWVYFQAYKNLYPPKRWEKIRKIINFLNEKKGSVSEKKIGSDTNTEIVPWFRLYTNENRN